MWIVRLALRRPLSVAVMALLMLVLGVLSFGMMNVDIFPAINLPIVILIYNYPGLSAVDMERRIVLIAERAYSLSVNDIEHIESESMRASGSSGSTFSREPILARPSLSSQQPRAPSPHFYREAPSRRRFFPTTRPMFLLPSSTYTATPCQGSSCLITLSISSACSSLQFLDFHRPRRSAEFSVRFWSISIRRRCIRTGFRPRT